MSWANAGCNLGDVVWVWKYQNSQNKVFEIMAIGKIDPAGHSAAEAEPSKPFVNALAGTLGGSRCQLHHKMHFVPPYY